MEELSLGDQKAVKQLLDEKAEVSAFTGWVSHARGTFIKGAGGGKADKRLVVLGQRRLFVLVKGKLEKDFPLLNLQEVESTEKEPLVATLRFAASAAGGKKSSSSSKAGSAAPLEEFGFQAETQEAVDEILQLSVGAFTAIFPGAPASAKPKVNVKPESRVPAVEPPEASLGGIADAYKACAESEGTPLRDDFVYDFESVWASAQVKVFNLNDLEVIPASQTADLRALFRALKYNNWFTVAAASNIKLSSDDFGALSATFRYNSKIESIRFDDLDMKTEDLVRISEALGKNTAVAVNSVSITNMNQVGDKGMSALGSEFIGKMKRGLIRLDVSGCQTKAAGMNDLCKALKANVHMASSLTVLNLSNNSLAADAGATLAQFLSSPTELVTLNLANCGAKLSPILSAMLRGCVTNLKYCDMSDNASGSGDTKSLVQYCKGSQALKSINMSGTGLDADSIKSILTDGIAANAMLSSVTVAFARNKLGAAGARTIGSVAKKLVNIMSLDVSENGFGDEGVRLLCVGLRDAPKLLTLDISRNFSGIAKFNEQERQAMFDSIHALFDLHDNECPIENLIMQGDSDRPKGGALSLGVSAAQAMYDAATNDQMRLLDVSGHGFGNRGAGAAGKMVTTNDKLQTFLWDNNDIGLGGFEMFYSGMRKNVTLLNCPLPINDIAKAASSKSSNPQKLTEVIHKIEDRLRFNQSPTAKFSSGAGEEEEGGQSSMAFLSSAGREEVQKLMFRLKSTGRKPPKAALPAINDANNQDGIMIELFGIKDALADEAQAQMRKGLAEAAKAAYPVFAELKAKLVSELLSAAASKYESMKGDEGKEEVRRLGTNLKFAFTGKDLGQDDFEKVLVTSAGAELANRANQALHGTMTTAADYLYEKLALKLQDALDELNADVQSEKGDGAAGGERKSSKSPKSDKGEKAATSSPKPEKAKKPEKKPETKAEPQGPVVDLSEIEATESNLEHLTADRAAGAANRRPPTRKRRPPPKVATAM